MKQRRSSMSSLLQHIIQAILPVHQRGALSKLLIEVVLCVRALGFMRSLPNLSTSSTGSPSPYQSFLSWQCCSTCTILMDKSFTRDKLQCTTVGAWYYSKVYLWQSIISCKIFVSTCHFSSSLPVCTFLPLFLPYTFLVYTGGIWGILLLWWLLCWK